MKKLIPLALAACLSLAMAGAYAAEEMKKDGAMMKQDTMQKSDMDKEGMKKPAKKHGMKKDAMGKDHMEHMGAGEMKKEKDEYKMDKGEMKK